MTFRYKKDLDPESDAAVRSRGRTGGTRSIPTWWSVDAEGKPYTVRYEEVNAMLLNEFLKEHRKVEELEQTNQRQEAHAVRGLKPSAALKAQAAQIQKVSDQLKAQLLLLVSWRTIDLLSA